MAEAADSSASIRALGEAVRRGERRALAKAITLVESTRPEDEAAAADLLEQILPATGRALRLGITGSPGAGKSTLIEALGSRWLGRGRTLAVLAVDPTSELTGGSLLGDKTRMPTLSSAEGAFVRPSPAGRGSAGVARRTGELILLCEAAGFDVVIVESVGVGQAELGVAHVVDWLVLLVLAGAGDELQGIKRGILEFADSVVVTKCDGQNVEASERARSQHAAALSVLRGSEAPAVISVSATEGTRIDELVQLLDDKLEAQRTTGVFDERRAEQRQRAFEEEFTAALRRALLGDARTQARIQRARERVARGDVSARAAVAELLLEVVSG